MGDNHCLSIQGDRNPHPHHQQAQILLKRRLVLTVLVLVLVLVLVMGTGFRANPVESPATLIDAPHQTLLIQNTMAETRPGKRMMAQEIAQRSFEGELGLFNLFIIFFVTLGPLKVIPVFVQVTPKASRLLRRQLAFRSALVSTIVILLVVLIGNNLLDVWQIQLPALMIAGGILLSLVALQIILTQYTLNTAEASSPDDPDLRLAITPLAFPTILPPFGIAIALTLMIVATEVGLSPWLVVILLLIVMGLNFISMLAARPIFKFIRPVTLKILGFTLGVMQFALGIQFILTGLEIQTLVLQILLRGR